MESKIKIFSASGTPGLIITIIARGGERGRWGREGKKEGKINLRIYSKAENSACYHEKPLLF